MSFEMIQPEPIEQPKLKRSPSRHRPVVNDEMLYQIVASEPMPFANTSTEQPIQPRKYRPNRHVKAAPPEEPKDKPVAKNAPAQKYRNPSL